MIVRNRVFRIGLSLVSLGALAIVLILTYNHSLEDSLPFVLYFIAWITIPAGFLICLTGIVLVLVRGSQHR
jgi:hypothetical protein